MKRWVEYTLAAVVLLLAITFGGLAIHKSNKDFEESMARIKEVMEATAVTPDRVVEAEGGHVCHVWYVPPYTFVACSDDSRALYNMMPQRPRQEPRRDAPRRDERDL